MTQPPQIRFETTVNYPTKDASTPTRQALN